MNQSRLHGGLHAAFLLLMLAPSACSCDGEPGQLDHGTDAGSPEGSGADGGPGTTPVKLTISPVDARLETDGATPAMQRFTVTAVLQDGSSQDVSDRAVFSLSTGELGSQLGPTFTSGLLGATGKLVASYLGMTTETNITVVLVREMVVTPPGGPALPPNIKDIFGKANTTDRSRAPKLVYPNDGTLFPRNLGGLEVHYRPGRQNALFEVDFKSPLSTISVYTRCTVLGEGCVYSMDPSVFMQIGESNHGKDPIQISVRGTSEAGDLVYMSNTASVSISAAPIAGGLYYWTTSAGTGIMRVDFGASQQVPERFFPFQGNGCFGCHALSRNGRRMSLSSNGIGDGRMTLLDVASKRILLRPEQNQREQFQSWNPTSDKFAGVWADSDPPDTNIRIRDGNTGAVLETINVGVEPDHPDWSPLGDRILFTMVTHNNVSQRPGRGGIGYIQQLPGGGWSAPTQLVRPVDRKNRYYPAYAPDARFFVYDESTCPAGQVYDDSCDGDADPSAKLWALPSDGGTPIQLARANARGIEDQSVTDLSNTFPKWAPFVDPLRADGSGHVMWMTFSSRRRYGLHAPVGSNQLLWMVAVDADAIVQGRDGSFAAFALPFQDISTSNHIAQWTAQIVSTPDPNDPNGHDGGSPDPGGGSDGGACRELGDICDPATDLCCNGATCSANGPNLFVCRPNL